MIRSSFPTLRCRAGGHGRGRYREEVVPRADEDRMGERFYSIARRVVDGDRVAPRDRSRRRSRTGADRRERKLSGPENDMTIPPQYRIWSWPEDRKNAIAALNPLPSPALSE
ncbi:MAG: hypothetical protein V6Z86_09175 [Hyphomicrobiales bacterium]